MRTPARAARYDGAEHRLRVLEAALAAFAERGYEATGTRTIAAAAGIEQGHLAYYFPSKQALWEQVIEAFARAPYLYLKEHIPDEIGAEPAETAKQILPGFLRVFARNGRLTRLMLQEFSVTSDRQAWLTEQFARPVWRLLEPLFVQLRAKGFLGGATPEVAYFSLLGAALVTFGNRDLVTRLTDEAGETEEWIDNAVSHMIIPILAPAVAA